MNTNSPEFLEESGNIQETVLRMLRYQFLKQKTKESIEETMFLLNLLVNHEAYDLDVLVDAFLKVESSLNLKEKHEIKQYIVKLYNSEKIYKNSPEREQIYESEKDPTVLLVGVYLEKRGQAAAYAKQMIPDIDRPLD